MSSIHEKGKKVVFTKSESDITFSDIKAFCDEYREGVRVEYKQEIRHIPKIVSSFAKYTGRDFYHRGRNWPPKRIK